VSFWSKAFWLAAVERAAKSSAQGLLGMWALDNFNVLHSDWGLAGGVVAGAAVLSLLTSMVSSPFGATPGSPSLVGEPTSPPAAPTGTHRWPPETPE
jgi:hypothetical protein